jgi:putative cell wall-binding protein
MTMNRSVGNALAASALVAFTAVLGATDAGAAAPQVERIAGKDRYETAALVAGRFPTGSEVYIASGENFPDSLAAGPAAGRTQSPILLVTHDAVPDVTKAQLRRLAPGAIIVVGGPAAISDQVVAQLETLTSGPVVRLAGDDRYGTAIALDQNAFTPGVDSLAITTGRDFPYALLLGSAGALVGVPLLLVDGQNLTAQEKAEITRLEPKEIFVFGDASVITDGLMDQIAQLGSAKRFTAPPYDASAHLWEKQDPSVGLGVILVTGANYPDALAAAGLAGLAPGRLTYLVPPNCVPAAVASEIARLQPPTITLIGGPAALSDNVANLVRCP